MTPDELVQNLNGLRSIYAWSLLTLHATNAIAVNADGAVIANGPQLLETIRHPNYWARQGRDVPGYLWDFREMAFESADSVQAVVASAEHRMFANMVCEGYELAKVCAATDKDRDEARWRRFCALAWARFARVVRNTLNHGLKVEVPQGVAFPIAWRDLTFTDDMVGHELLVQDFFDMPHAFALIEDMAASARNDFRV